MKSGLDYVIVGASMYGSVFARCVAEAERRALIGGRLGSFQHLDMQQVIGQTMVAAQREAGQPRRRAARAA